MNYWMGYKPKWGLFSEIRRNNISARVTVQLRKTGATYGYNDVPLHVYRDFRRCAEKGWFWNKYLKGTYVEVRLRKGRRPKGKKVKNVVVKSRQLKLLLGG